MSDTVSGQDSPDPGPSRRPPDGATYAELYAGFRWNVPARYNMGVAVSDRHADAHGERTALIHIRSDGRVERLSFREVRAQSNRLANALLAKGLRRGDRLAILLPQTPEAAVAHLAAYRAGLVAVPLFTLFGPDALEYRLANSGARGLVTDAANYAKVAGIRDRLPDLEVVATTEPAGGDALLYEDLLARASADFAPVDTAAEEPALLIYTSGTTGPPKGALHAHRTLIGHMPGVDFYYDFPPRPGDLFWTPADWAWIGGLMDVLIPAWFHGLPVVAHRMTKFDPEFAFRLMEEHEVRNAFLPPTALKLMRQVPDPERRFRLRLRSVFTGGETTGAELLEWSRKALGVTLHEGYGQTECNLVVGNCSAVMEVRPGSMGRAVPGHEVAVIGPDGEVLPAGEPGMIAVRRPDPVMFLEYWRNPEATAAKFLGDWLLTGDVGTRDEDGYFWFVGRDDDVIISAGYRIGPGEIEDCLLRHPAVAVAAAVGAPDPLRGEVVKAFVVPAEGIAATPALAADIQAFVRSRLAAHEYPREIAFVDSLPMTATGKIRRKELKMRERERADAAAGRRADGPK